MKKLAVVLAAVPAAVFAIAMLGAVTTTDAKGRPPETKPEVPTVTVTVTREMDRNVEAGGYIGYVVRMESAQRVLGPFRLEDDCTSAARLLNGARPNAFACRAERH